VRDLAANYQISGAGLGRKHRISDREWMHLGYFLLLQPRSEAAILQNWLAVGLIEGYG